MFSKQQKLLSILKNMPRARFILVYIPKLSIF